MAMFRVLKPLCSEVSLIFQLKCVAGGEAEPPLTSLQFYKTNEKDSDS